MITINIPGCVPTHHSPPNLYSTAFFVTLHNTEVKHEDKGFIGVIMVESVLHPLIFVN